MADRTIEVFRTFEGGLWPDRSPLSPQNTLRKMENCVLSQEDVGAVRSVEGVSDVTLSGLPANFDRFRSLYRAEDSSGNQLIAAGLDQSGGSAGGYIYTITPGGTLTQRKTGLTQGTTPCNVVIRDEMLFFNGSDTPFKISSFSSPSVADIGATRPDTSDKTVVNCALSASGGTNVKGYVRYYMSEIVDDDTETALSLVILQNDAAGTEGIDCSSGDDVDITITGGVASKTYQLYRTLRNGTQPFLIDGGRITTDGSGNGSYTDDTSDATLTGILPYAHGDPPPSGISAAVVHFGRVWGIAGSTLYWSDLIDHESWWTEANGNKADIYPDDGDTGTALARTPNGILVFKEHHLYHAFGRIPDQLEIQEVTLADQNNRNVGTPSFQSVAALPGGYGFYYNKGVYLYQGGSISYISGPIEDTLRRAIRNQDESGVTLGWDPQRRYLMVSVPTADADLPNETYIFDPQRGVWCGHMTLGFEAYAVIEDANGNEEFWGAGGGGDASTNKIAHIFDGTDFYGTDIACDLEFPHEHGRNPSWEKVWRFVEPHFKTKDSGSFNVVTEIDSVFGSTTTTNISQVKTGQDRHSRRVNLGWRGRELKVRITSEADQPRWKIYGVNYGISEEEGLSR